MRNLIERYTLNAAPGEQITPMADNWYLVHHTEVPTDHWWAVRHKCDNGDVYGMAYHSGKHTECKGCKKPCPSEMGGFISMLEWQR